ncbi:MAG: sugar phosphate nucleotidyltransferase, partial [Oscillospiraceae bacterium]
VRTALSLLNLEKPKKPKSTNTYSGMYFFKWSVLKAFLEADEAGRTSENDFGKNIIPAILNAGHRLYAYRFEGYWKDVGTISGLWEANMDLLGKHPAFDIYSMPVIRFMPEIRQCRQAICKICRDSGKFRR